MTKQKSLYYVQPYMDGFYFIKSHINRGIIATIYDGYITFYAECNEAQRKDIYQSMVVFIKSVKLRENEKTKQPA